MKVLSISMARKGPRVQVLVGALTLWLALVRASFG